MEIEIVILTFISIITFSFGLNILRTNPNTNRRQLLLFCLIASQFFWVLSNLLTLFFYNVNFFNLFFTKLSFAFGAIISIAFLALITEITQVKSKIFIRILFAIQVLWISLSFTDLVIISVIVGDNSLKSVNGNLHSLYSLCLGLTFFYSFAILFKSYKNSRDINFKLQIKYILYGGLISIILTILTSLIIPKFGIELRSLGPSSMMIFVGSTFYAVSHHRFLQLNVALSNLFSYIMLSIIPLASFLIVYTINTRLFGSVYAYSAIIFGYGQSALFIILFKKSQNIVKIIFNQKINSDFVETKKLTSQFEKQISSEFQKEVIFSKLINIMNKSMSSSRFVILSLEKDNLLIHSSNGEFPKNIYQLIPIFKYLERIEIDYIDMAEEVNIDSEFCQRLKENEVEAIFTVNKKLFFILFTKFNQQVYNTYEIEFIHRITQILEISLERADLYQKQRNLSETLKKEIKQATKEILEQKEIIQKKYEEERDMLGILGHELRTPLTVAKNMNQLLLEKVKKMSSEKKYDPDYIINKVSIIDDALIKETNIVETTLASSRIDNKKVEVINENVNLMEIINFSIEAHKQMALKKGLNLTFESEKNIPIIVSDNTKVQEIVTNLVSNAIKYTHKGFVKIKLAISRDSQFIEITIQDSGEGIPKDSLEKLGSKFYRINQHLDQKNNIVRPGGVGLGLYVVKNYIKIIGGKLKIDSDVGKGSTFTVSIPLRVSADSSEDEDNVNIFQNNPDMFQQLGLHA